jgi:hypothetical protein
MGKFDSMKTGDASKATTRGKDSQARVPFSIRVRPDFKERIQAADFYTKKDIAEVIEEALEFFEKKYKDVLDAGK